MHGPGRACMTIGDVLSTLSVSVCAGVGIIHIYVYIKSGSMCVSMYAPMCPCIHVSASYVSACYYNII